MLYIDSLVDASSSFVLFKENDPCVILLVLTC